VDILLILIAMPLYRILLTRTRQKFDFPGNYIVLRPPAVASRRAIGI